MLTSSLSLAHSKLVSLAFTFSGQSLFNIQNPAIPGS
jgi:hypothetical protein